MNTKICTTCNRTLPATLDYFYKSKDGKFGLRSVCKDCYRADRLNRLANMDPEFRRNMKKAEAQRNRHTYRQAARKAKALASGVHHEDWTEKQLIETYGTECYICNESIDLTLPRQGEGSQYSLWPDHIIPTSRGGENTIRNVRPCHRKCNQDKYNLTYEEYLDKKENDRRLNNIKIWHDIIVDPENKRKEW
jgi:5-methylcytosine-specific restriction endonuclease McrA